MMAVVALCYWLVVPLNTISRFAVLSFFLSFPLPLFVHWIPICLPKMGGREIGIAVGWIKFLLLHIPRLVLLVTSDVACWWFAVLTGSFPPMPVSPSLYPLLFSSEHLPLSEVTLPLGTFYLFDCSPPHPFKISIPRTSLPHQLLCPQHIEQSLAHSKLLNVLFS